MPENSQVVVHTASESKKQAAGFLPFFCQYTHYVTNDATVWYDGCAGTTEK